MDGVLVAENDELSRIFDGMKSAAPHLVKEPLATDEAFHIRHLASDDAAFSDGFCAEKLDDPAIRGDGNGKALHPATLPQPGKRAVNPDTA